MAKSRSGAGLVCLSLLLVADGCREQTAPASARAEEARLDGVGCEALVPAAFAATTLGHDVRYSESRQRAVRFQVVSCEHVTMKAEQVFAFDVGCGSGARERFVTVSRSLEKAVRQTEPKIGDEAWASPNVYVAWHARVACYTTVLLSWRRPRDSWLLAFSERLRAHVLGTTASNALPGAGVR